MQQEASTKLGFGAKKTMMVAQSLYEGVELANGFQGLITYMRTDSTRLSDVARNDARAFIGEQFGEDYLPPKANVYVTGKKAGTTKLMISTAYDYYLYGENLEGFVFDIYKYNSTDGRIVYYTPTGSKYHFSANCAGDNARETTLSEAQSWLEPCGKCAY